MHNKNLIYQVWKMRYLFVNLPLLVKLLNKSIRLKFSPKAIGLPSLNQSMHH